MFFSGLVSFFDSSVGFALIVFDYQTGVRDAGVLAGLLEVVQGAFDVLGGCLFSFGLSFLAEAHHFGEVFSFGASSEEEDDSCSFLSSDLS